MTVPFSFQTHSAHWVMKLFAKLQTLLFLTVRTMMQFVTEAIIHWETWRPISTPPSLCCNNLTENSGCTGWYDVVKLPTKTFCEKHETVDRRKLCFLAMANYDQFPKTADVIHRWLRDHKPIYRALSLNAMYASQDRITERIQGRWVIQSRQ